MENKFEDIILISRQGFPAHKIQAKRIQGEWYDEKGTRASTYCYEILQPDYTPYTTPWMDYLKANHPHIHQRPIF